MEQKHRKRIRHFDGTLDARFLTFSCYQRRAYFLKPRTCGWMLHALALARREHSVHLWAYVIMPEHTHVLIWPTVRSFEVSAFLSTVKQSVSKRALNYLKKHAPHYLEKQQGSFHFWQDGPGFDRNLWEPAAVWDAIDYIHLNPVRRGLCERPEDWEGSSCRWYAGHRLRTLAIDASSLPQDPRVSS
ncbi:MAG: transposase [Planctomycetes bacterium]|nr:transposase [Planctomycetota bacterium]